MWGKYGQNLFALGATEASLTQITNTNKSYFVCFQATEKGLLLVYLQLVQSLYFDNIVMHTRKLLPIKMLTDQKLNSNHRCSRLRIIYEDFMTRVGFKKVSIYNKTSILNDFVVNDFKCALF